MITRIGAEHHDQASSKHPTFSGLHQPCDDRNDQKQKNHRILFFFLKEVKRSQNIVWPLKIEQSSLTRKHNMYRLAYSVCPGNPHLPLASTAKKKFTVSSYHLRRIFVYFYLLSSTVFRIANLSKYVETFVVYTST